MSAAVGPEAKRLNQWHLLVKLFQLTGQPVWSSPGPCGADPHEIITSLDKFLGRDHLCRQRDISAAQQVVWVTRQPSTAHPFVIELRFVQCWQHRLRCAFVYSVDCMPELVHPSSRQADTASNDNGNGRAQDSWAGGPVCAKTQTQRRGNGVAFGDLGRWYVTRW